MTKDSELKGRVAIVTGAGKGIGRACAMDLAARGAAVLVNNRRHPDESDEQTSAAQVVAAIHAAGGQAEADFQSVQAEGAGIRMVDHALRRFGRIDILVANAASSQATTFRKQSLQDFLAIFDVGFRGALQLVHAAWPHLLDQRWGRVVMMTSSAGRYGNHGLGAYSASKAAIEMLTRSLAAEGIGHGVRVNAVSPYAYTQMTHAYLPEDLARCLTPQAVAPMVSWLVSEACTANGEVIVAGGGRFRRGFSVETQGVAGEDMAQVFSALRERPGQPHSDANHAFASLVEEFRRAGQLP
jgi:NAD(P)-dependent dehydrogenase (short-subunit alcohol dehydrogenase family)